MFVRPFAVMAAAILTLVSALPVNAGAVRLIRVCTANGVRLVPFPGEDNEPSRPHQGACHAACLGERLKMPARKPAG
ncbi:MAG: hypothetical protein A3E78_03170 [Alphaproteobacteria bacterium RIFCSPHIGHO2_12_FULL_63_12]|nr:MAG: hypothetical protein A3E78_03170 [Alphaproteobacteria bacterium RIFCSPHIGHO2_12_FULL_63_12]